MAIWYFKKVVDNLLGNVATYSPPSNVRVNLRQAEEKVYLTIEKYGRSHSQKMIFPNCLSRFIVWSNHATVKQAVADWACILSKQSSICINNWSKRTNTDDDCSIKVIFEISTNKAVGLPVAALQYKKHIQYQFQTAAVFDGVLDRVQRLSMSIIIPLAAVLCLSLLAVAVMPKIALSPNSKQANTSAQAAVTGLIPGHLWKSWSHSKQQIEQQSVADFNQS